MPVPTTLTELCGDPNGRALFATVLEPRTTPRRSIPVTLPASANFVSAKRSSKALMRTAPGKDFWSWKNLFAPLAAANAQWMAITFNSGGCCCGIPSSPHGEMLCTDSLRETYAAIYKTVKTAKPPVPVGWHIWHNNSFNPIYRAEQDLHELSNYSDFIKVVMYNNCGGERMALYADNIGSTLYGDLSKQSLIDFNYAVMRFKERSYDQIPHTGLSADYVFRETKRALDGVAGTKTLIWPGIDIDIPTEPNNSKCTPQSVKEAVLAAFRAGAPGVILSRKYSEMRLADLVGAGDAIRELKVSG